MVGEVSSEVFAWQPGMHGGYVGSNTRRMLGGRVGGGRATVVGLGQIELRSYKMRTFRWTVIISKQVICTAIFELKTLHVRKCPSRSSHLVT